VRWITRSRSGKISGQAQRHAQPQRHPHARQRRR
jgi:hypothetical protein